MSAYAPLWVKSNFSFLEGASHPEELVERAHELGLSAVALTDRDGLYGAVRAHVKAKELGVRVIHGAELTVVCDEGLEAAATAALSGGRADEGAARAVLLAEDRAGYEGLSRLITVGRLRCPKGSAVVSWREASERAEGLHLLLPPAAADGPDGRPENAAPLGSLADAFAGRLHLLVPRHLQDDEPARERRQRARARRARLPIVAATEVLYHTRRRRPLQDVLTCIRAGVSVETAGRRLRPNAEHDLKAEEAVRALYEDDPAALARTLELADRCRFSLAELRYRYPTERLSDGTTSMDELRRLTLEGARRRYPRGVPAEVLAQVRKELALIEELDYPGYFLTMWEVVSYCRAQGILCQGRGSAANSAVCYCLGVTAVDPTRIDLLFERFLSRERKEPPDIDLDIAHERREEVIQHVYERYGRERAAMVANVIRYRARSAVREVGKALGLAETALDRLARLVGWRAEGSLERPLRAAGLDPDAPGVRHLARLVDEIEDTPRHLSIHPGGFLLGHEPVPSIVPVENAAMDGRTVIQWDKDDLEDLGLFKVDLLGLGALSLVDRCFTLLREEEGVDLDLATVPKEDPLTYDMMGEGDTVGVFQIESRAQMAMLPRLRPKSFYDLVIEVSIVRPGPVVGKMVHPYLRRRAGEEEVIYPHPCLEPVLRKTLGVPLFQEQVMRLAVVAADYTPGEADQLRRDMAAWRRTGRIERHRARLIERMGRKGIDEEFAERVFDQIRGFGSYGFPESHAASFALLAYATAWLKRHHPAAFACALLNAQPMGFYSPATIVGDARRHGIRVRPVCVLRSAWDCTLEDEEEGARAEDGRRRLAIRMGLRYVKGLGEAAGKRLLAARAAWLVGWGLPHRRSDGGASPTLRPGSESAEALAALLQHAALDQGRRAALAEAGALAAFGLSRRGALWAAQAPGAAARDPEAEAQPLLPAPPEEGATGLPPLSALEEVIWDYRRTEHSPRNHPLGPLREDLARAGLPSAEEVRAMADGRRVRYAGMVICRQQPGTAKGVVFMTLEDETGFVNVILWERVFQRFQVLARTEAFLGIAGQLQNRDGVAHIVARSLFVPRVATRPAKARSRDFQ